MPPRKVIQRGDVAEPSRPRQRARRDANPHDIIFIKPEHRHRYAAHLKRKLIPTRYICTDTLDHLGLTTEVHRMFHSVGMLEFMQFEAPTFERITLEFLSTVEFRLKHRWTGTEREYYGTLTFRLFNNEHELTVDQLGAVLRLPISGPGAAPDSFAAGDFWRAITGLSGYVAKEAKSSRIHNPCFRYAQKGLAYSLFGRGDSNGVATQRELFILYCMAYQQPVNLAAFAADFLGRVGRASTGGISVGGMITQIADHFNYSRELFEVNFVPGKTKIDMEALVNQLMIQIHHDYYSLVIHGKHILTLPAPNRISITNMANWLYENVAPDDGDDEMENVNAGIDGEDETLGEEQGEEEDHPQQFYPTNEGSSQMPPNQWEWVHNEIGHLRTEQERQSVELFRQGEELRSFGTEQTRQGAAIDDMHAMMQRLMLHYPYPPPPPQ